MLDLPDPPADRLHDLHRKPLEAELAGSSAAAGICRGAAAVGDGRSADDGQHILYPMIAPGL